MFVPVLAPMFAFVLFDIFSAKFLISFPPPTTGKHHLHPTLENPVQLTGFSKFSYLSTTWSFLLYTNGFFHDLTSLFQF